MTSVVLSLVMRVRRPTTRSTLLLTDPSGDVVIVQRPEWRDRLTARLCCHRLDRALADGTPPGTSAALALRAQRLTGLAFRRTLAGAFRRLVRDGDEGIQPSAGQIVPNRAGVTEAREELSLLADRLVDPGPVAAHGVAQAWLLLADGTGPLYNPDSRTRLSVLAGRAGAALRPWPAYPRW